MKTDTDIDQDVERLAQVVGQAVMAGLRQALADPVLAASLRRVLEAPPGAIEAKSDRFASMPEAALAAPASPSAAAPAIPVAAVPVPVPPSPLAPPPPVSGSTSNAVPALRLPQTELPTPGAATTEVRRRVIDQVASMPPQQTRTARAQRTQTGGGAKPRMHALNERYIVHARVPQSDGTEVLVANDKDSGQAALITLLPTHEAEDQPTENALADLERLVWIRHAHVVPVLGFGLHDGRLFVAEEAVRGKTIGALLSGGEPLAEADVLRLALQATQGLQHMHVHGGIIHGGIDAGSIVVSYAGIAGFAESGEIESAKIGGFGRPRTPWHDARRCPRDAVPWYVAPEAFDGGAKPDPRADIYSLGAVMYHLLTGRTPYQGDPEEVREWHLHGDPPDPGFLVASLSDDIRQIVLTCMAKQPGDRFLSHQGLIVACEKALRGRAPEDVRSMCFLRRPILGEASTGSGPQRVVPVAPTPAPATTPRSAGVTAATARVPRQATARTARIESDTRTPAISPEDLRKRLASPPRPPAPSPVASSTGSVPAVQPAPEVLTPEQIAAREQAAIERRKAAMVHTWVVRVVAGVITLLVIYVLFALVLQAPHRG